VALGAAVAFAAVPVLSSASTTVLHEWVPATMRGRAFALRGGVNRALDPIGAVVAGVIVARVAEPAMSPGGVLGSSAGRVLGTGEGRGAALLLALVAVALAVIAIAARSNPSLQRLDEPRSESRPVAGPSPATAVSAGR
jgi:hypothetical protein